MLPSKEQESQREIIRSGEIPLLHVEGKTLPDVWERSVLILRENGTRVKTQYDRPEDPPSFDSTMVMVVSEPLTEPRIHLRLPTGLEELEIYRQEVVEGIHDHYVGEYGWSYSYHDRLTRYPISSGEFLDQIQIMIEQLAKSPYTRRAQAITWVPELDAGHHEPPCLQRVWCRILEDENGELVLNMNTNWRSRDAFKAAFMNMFVLTDLQRKIAEEVGERVGKPVRVGRYVDISDSYHIYGKDYAEFERFKGGLARRTFEQRTMTMAQAEESFIRARMQIFKEMQEKSSRHVS